MKRSALARLSARPSSRFTGPAGGEKERRLGLHSGLAFQRAASRPSFLRPSRVGLHTSGWNPVAPWTGTASPSGLVRHAVRISWTGFGRPRADRRSSLAPAPWRG